jgi:N-formylglutamate deformylase
MIRITHKINETSSPLLVTAIHEGHEVRPEILKYFAIDEFDRLREEDPYTGFLSNISESRIIVHTSRFEIDLNRPRENAVYRTPDQSWGLKVWKDDVSVSVWEYSLGEYDYFYGFLERTIRKFIDYWGYVIVYDIHSYNFRRNGPGTEDSPEMNPEVNVGTGTMDRQLWAPVVDHFLSTLKNTSCRGKHLDVRENIKFRGGHLSNWIHKNYRNRGCVLSIEFKKFFMDEWTGAVDVQQLKELKKILKATIPGVLRTAEIEQAKMEA